MLRDISERPSPSLFNAILPNILLTAVIAYPPPRWGKYLFIAIYAYFTYVQLRATTGIPFSDYVSGCLIFAELVNAIDLVLLEEPVDELRHQTDKASPRELPMFKRLYWAFCLIWSPRSYGWTNQNGNIKPPPVSSKMHFILRGLLRAAGYFLLIDLGQSWMTLTPNYAITRAPRPGSGIAYEMFVRFFNIVMCMVKVFGTLSFGHTLVGVIVVGLGLVEPRFWPDLWGSIVDAYTIRRFWSRYWHQLMYRFMKTFSRTFSKALDIPLQSQISCFILLVTSFTISGLIHALGGDFMVDPQHVGASFPFFMSQIAGIVLEDVMIWTGKKAGIQFSTPVARVVGLFWVFLWFTLSSPLFLDWAVSMGMDEDGFVNASPIRALIEYYGIDAPSTLAQL
ncbi:hypothetical protein AX16_008957 [Volvariella volvacea WC 439]|nr:hypothetical protein AX16_008957 [Volvariella volvacea WC 439]